MGCLTMRWLVQEKKHHQKGFHQPGLAWTVSLIAMDVFATTP
jgi:hypothetical protein